MILTLSVKPRPAMNEVSMELLLKKKQTFGNAPCSVLDRSATSLATTSTPIPMKSINTTSPTSASLQHSSPNKSPRSPKIPSPEKPMAVYDRLSKTQTVAFSSLSSPVVSKSNSESKNSNAKKVVVSQEERYGTLPYDNQYRFLTIEPSSRCDIFSRFIHFILSFLLCNTSFCLSHTSIGSDAIVERMMAAVGKHKEEILLLEEERKSERQKVETFSPSLGRKSVLLAKKHAENAKVEQKFALRRVGHSYLFLPIVIPR